MITREDETLSDSASATIARLYARKDRATQQYMLDENEERYRMALIDIERKLCAAQKLILTRG